MTKTVRGITPLLEGLVYKTAPEDIVLIAGDGDLIQVITNNPELEARVVNNVVTACKKFGKGYIEHFEKALLLYYPELFVHTWAYNDSDLKIIVLSHEREVWQDLSEYAKLINLFVKYLGV